METWKHVWREAIAPHLSTAGLAALADALQGDSPALLQGATTAPPPLVCMQDSAPQGACPIGYAGWRGDALQTIGKVEEHFARVCYRADQELGEPTACRWFISWWDDAPREEARRLLLPEVRLILAKRWAPESADAQPHARPAMTDTPAPF